MSRWSRLLQRWGRRSWFAPIARRVAPPADRLLYRATGGWLTVIGHDVFPTLLLTTTGRHTGKRRTVPLLYLDDGEAIAVAATSFGQPRHPDWACNLLARPDAEIQIGRRRERRRARPVDPVGFERLWPRFVAMWPAYEDYRRKAGREIRLFLLDPI